jgi:hypothetical protein
MDGGDAPVRPCRIELLAKGQYLPPGYLEHRWRLVRQTQAYQLQMRALIDRIRSERPDLAAHVRQDRDGIRIMEDLEADTYDHDRRRILVRQLRRSAKRRASIDRAKFSAESRRAAENEDQVASAIAGSCSAAVRAARRKRLFDGD